MTTTRKNLITILGYIQNSVRFQDVDIMTFAGWHDVSEAHIRKHILDCFAQLDNVRKSQIHAMVCELRAMIAA